MNRPKTEGADCDVLILGVGLSGCAAGAWPQLAAGESALSRDGQAIAPILDNNGLTLG